MGEANACEALLRVQPNARQSVIDGPAPLAGIHGVSEVGVSDLPQPRTTKHQHHRIISNNKGTEMATTFTNAAALEQAIGQSLGATEWITIDQQRVDTFAEATGDHQWIHVDPVKARTGPFGGTIAHG